MSISERLRDLSCNLYWTWHPELIELFRDLDPQLWRDVGHNPVEFLSRFGQEELASRAEAVTLEARIGRAFYQMREYLDSVDTWGRRYASPLRRQPVAYFSAEFGLHESLPIYAGGLGVLAGDHLKAASDLDVPMVGVGLFYAKGYFQQRIDQEGWQREEYLTSDIEKLPLDLARDEDGRPLRVYVDTAESRIWAMIRTALVGRNRLILLDTDVEDNSEADRGLSATLYGGDRWMRIRQELVLGIAGLRAIQAMDICQPGALHMNEGHSCFAALELARTMMHAEGRRFDEVAPRAAGRCVFTTHTPVEAGHDRFDADTIDRALRPMREQLGLDHKALMSLGRVNGQDDNEPFCMTVLGLRMSRHRNGVSARHGQESRRMWHAIWPDRGVEEVPIGHITNGIHTASWQATDVVPIYNRYLGADWLCRKEEPATWMPIREINKLEYWEQHQLLKAHLVQYVHRCMCRRADRLDTDPPDEPVLDAAALTIGFARRFAPYKRADLLLRDADWLEALVNDADRPVQILFAGKAHPGDEQGHKLIQKIVQASKEPRFSGRIIFLENHDMNVGRHMVQGVDVWLNTPRRPLEACGTSGQKVVLNGGLHASTLDGWWAEAYDGENGFAIGCGDEHADTDAQDQADLESLKDVLQNRIVPLYYQRNEQGVPEGWIDMQIRSLQTLPWRFCAHRMVMDYTNQCYLPAAGAVQCVMDGT
jgi:starch phosphorylase